MIVTAIALDKETRTSFLLLLKPTFPDNSVLQLTDKWLWMNSLEKSSCRTTEGRECVSKISAPMVLYPSRNGPGGI